MKQNSYAGDVSVQDARQALSDDETAVLIDVRTRAEWSYVGIPIFSDPSREALLVEWLSYPDMQVNADFSAIVTQQLASKGIKTDAALFFLCRSGVRSKHAAIEMTSTWQGPCFNIAGGFEGDLDGALHRGTCNGWKHAGLPWRQY